MTSESDKNIRLSVLRMAVSMCDHEHMVAQEIEREAKPKLRAHTPYPTDEEVIAKAKKLMMFVDDISDPTVKNVTQLLTEQAGK
jgi:hypothetical protein